MRLTRHAAVRQVRALPILLGLAFAATVPVVAAPGTACAGGEQRAVLVVDSGSRDLRYCVALDGDAVSGIELIRLAGAQHGLDFRLGFGGEAVCRLAGVGTDGGDCFGGSPDFWGYWRGEATGGWSWSSTGAGDTVVHAGDVEGWSWGSGQDGATHPQPAPTAFTEVCGVAPDPAGDPGDQHDGGGGNPGGESEPGGGPEAEDDPIRHSTRGDVGGSSGGGDSAGGATSGSREPEREPEREGSAGGDGPNRPTNTDGEDAGAAPSAPASPVGAIAAPATDGDGPPASGLAVLAIVLVLVVAGAIAARRTRASE